ncbi:MAG: AAA family ATPase [Planctomycetales bacterium]|nr:AAA family ATPase [Planctomycetales bacterium]
MSNVLRLAIVDPDDDSRDELKKMLLAMDIVWLEAECSRYEFFSDVVEQTHPDVGVVCIDSEPEKAISLIQNLRDDCGDCSVLVVSTSNDGQLILQTVRAGAKEFLTRPVSGEELLGALERIANARFGTGDRSVSSSVIAVGGVTGGVGCTSLAVNLGCVLAASERNTVALVDLDMALGDADVFLDTIPDYTLADVAQNVSRLDFSLLKKSLTKHSSGVYLLPRPVQLQEIEMIDEDSLQRVFGLLKATFSHLIVDLSKGFSRIDLAAMAAARHVLLMTQLDLPCLRNVVRLMTSFEEYDGLADKVKIVVNRVGMGNGQISLKKAQETIGREVFWQLPNDYRTMIEVRNNGVPLIEQSPKAGITQSIVSLAERLVGGTTSEAPPADAAPAGAKQGGWLRFWPGKKK